MGEATIKHDESDATPPTRSPQFYAERQNTMNKRSWPSELFQDFENARYDMHKRLSKDFKAALTDPEKTLISRDYHTNYVLKH